MAIKNLFGRGIGFGGPEWIPTHGYSIGAVIDVVDPPSPHRLAAVDYVTHDLTVEGLFTHLLSWESVTTYLAWQTAEGDDMSSPLIFTRTETGAVTLVCTGSDGTPEDLSTASAVTLTVVPAGGGTAIVSAVALTSPTAEGTAVWTRLTAQVATAGNFFAQVKVTRADATIALYPNASQLPGMPISILPAVGD